MAITTRELRNLATTERDRLRGIADARKTTLYGQLSGEQSDALENIDLLYYNDLEGIQGQRDQLLADIYNRYNTALETATPAQIPTLQKARDDEATAANIQYEQLRLQANDQRDTLRTNALNTFTNLRDEIGDQFNTDFQTANLAYEEIFQGRANPETQFDLPSNQGITQLPEFNFTYNPLNLAQQFEDINELLFTPERAAEEQANILRQLETGPQVQETLTAPEIITDRTGKDLFLGELTPLVNLSPEDAQNLFNTGIQEANLTGLFASGVIDEPSQNQLLEIYQRFGKEAGDAWIDRVIAPTVQQSIQETAGTQQLPVQVGEGNRVIAQEPVMSREQAYSSLANMADQYGQYGFDVAGLPEATQEALTYIYQTYGKASGDEYASDFFAQAPELGQRFRTNVPQIQLPTAGAPTATTTGSVITGGIPGPTTGVGAIPQGVYPTTTFQRAPYTPPPLLAAAPDRPTLTPTQQLIGAPEVYRPTRTPMPAMTPEQAGSQFVSPTQEDYFAYFGYTPEQLNAAQFLAEMEGAPRAGIAAQTVPVLPAAVAGAPTGMKEGGSVKNSGLMAAAEDLASKGRNGDKMLVHMTVDEVDDLQNYAQQLGGSLTINPYTGLPEANFFKRVGRGLKKIARSPLALPLVAAFAAPYLPAIAGSTAVTAGLLGAAGTMLGGGDLQQGLQRGLMAGMGASAAQSMGYQGIPGVPTSAQAGALQSSGSALGAGVDAGAVSLTPSPGDLDYISAADKTLLGRTTDYLYNIPSAVGDGLSKMDLGDAAMLGYVGMGAAGLKENQQAQKEYEQYQNEIDAKKRRERQEAGERFLRDFGAEGGRVRLAQGGMTYAEGGGTTGATNEPRMVKGTGDGMSDSVPATIEGVQEARLANDEFVIPADVVADIGNGSSSAGAQQLYDMMDRVRQARHGTTEQPPEIDVRKLMPA